MRAFVKAFIPSFLIIIGTSSCQRSSDTLPTLRLYTAASLTDVVQELAKSFNANTSRKRCDFEFNFASSGALARQLVASPKADLFLSANTKWMQHVQEAGIIASQNAEVFLTNTLVVISHHDSTFPDSIQTASEFASLPFEYLCMGDPAYVPAGQYAKTWLTAETQDNGSTLWEQLNGRISPTNDVRAALIQVMGSSNVIGIVYKSDYLHRKQSLRLLMEIDPNHKSAPKISYMAGILNQSQSPELARSFFEFLTSKPAKAIFEKHGFSPPNSEVEQ